MTDRLIVNARLLDATGERRGALLVRHNRIAAAGPDVTADDLTPEDAGGTFLMPAAIDLRAHIPDADLGGADQAGIATVATYPPVESYRALRGSARSYGVITMGRAGQQLGTYTDTALDCAALSDGPTTLSARILSAALTYARLFDARVVTHPDEPTLTAGTCATESARATLLGLPAAPAAAEAIGVARDLALARLTGGALHLANVTTAAAVELIRKAKDEGIDVTADTSPAYFDLNDTAIGDYDTAFRLCPPLRGEADRQAVLAALADGTLDAIASDHRIVPPEAKAVPFALATPGGAGWTTLLPLAFAHLSPVRAVAALTTGPARIIRHDLPTLAVGAPADLVLFDPDKPFIVPADPPSPFARRPMQGVVIGRIRPAR